MLLNAKDNVYELGDSLAQDPVLRRRMSIHNSLAHSTALAGITHFTQSVKDSAVVPNACCIAGT